jgi:hypothetical protein
MHVQPALPIVPRSLSSRTRVEPYNDACMPRTILAVETIGYLVARTDFAGRIHSVFAQACNVACQGRLLTLCTRRAGNGPLTLRLAGGGPQDLRELLAIGERVDASQGCLRTRRAELRWALAAIWRPAKLRALPDQARIDTRVELATMRLAQLRHAHPSIIDGDGVAVVAALRDSCRNLDGAQAALQVERLIGWGEGLTPAGDDFLVGLLAGLDTLVQGDPRRRRFRDALAATLIGCVERTTPVSAQYLRLAAGSHYGEPLISLRDALITEPHRDVVDAALRTALAVGATSGADTVSGLLAGLAAWAVPASAHLAS